jgi:hypothetical protein
MQWLPLLFLAWPASVGLLWLVLFLPIPEGRCERHLTKRERLLLGVPPTLLLTPFLILLVASPTAQFNAGSDLGMRLWSFWVAAWKPIWIISGGFCIAYLAAALALLAYAEKRYLVWSAAIALVSCGIAWLVLGHAFPTA